MMRKILVLTVLCLSANLFAESPFEKKAIEMGFVNIKSIDRTIAVDLKYSSTDNFLKKDVYGDLNDCYLKKETALMLKKAHDSVKKINPDYRFIVYDGLRSVNVQKTMWDIVKGTPQQGYVADPETGSLHNYGTAVDLTLGTIGKDGKVTPLDMGTPFDFFGREAQPRYEDEFLKKGVLTEIQIKNRLILRNAMKGAGFQYIKNEWWHFNSHSLSYSKENFEPFP